MKTDTICERSLPITRSTTDATLTVEGEKLRGYAVVYGARSAGPVEIAGQYMMEVIDRGAFKDSVGTRNVPFTFEHREFAEYGDTATGTLTLAEDEKGVRFELALPAYANVLRQQIQTGAIRGMSFGFVPKAIEVRDGIRHVVKAELLHISPVYSPAYPQTSVELTRQHQPNLDLKKKRITLAEKSRA